MLPEPSQIELSGASRYRRGRRALLDVAVAAQHFDRFGDDHRRALAEPVLERRRRDAPAQALRLPLRRSNVDASRSASDAPLRLRSRDRRARSASAAAPTAAGRTRAGAAHGAVPAPPRCLHHAGAADRAIEPRVLDHFDDHLHAAAFVAEQPGGAPSNSTSHDAFERLPSLSFSRCRRTALRVPSGRTRGRKKHDRPFGRSAPAPDARRTSVPRRTTCVRSAGIRRPPDRLGARRWRARPSRPGARSCPCRSAPRSSAAPATRADRSRATGCAAAIRRQPRHGAGVPAQQRHGGEGHRQRTLGAVLDFGSASGTPPREPPARRRALRSTARRARLRSSPASTARATPDRIRPRRCDCRSGRAFEARRRAIGARRQRRHLGAAERRAPLGQPIVRPCRAAPLDGGAQRAIAQIEVASLVRRRLVGVGRPSRDYAAGGRSALFGRKTLQTSSCVSM